MQMMFAVFCLQCRRHRFYPWVGKEDPPEEETATHSYSCLGDPIERSLAGYSPWGRRESDTTENMC